MISDLDETIKKLLITKGAFEPSQIDIRFEAPDREWSTSISKPTVNIYLYDIRENHKLRSTDWVIAKDANGNATRKKTPSRIDVSYLITVWSNDIGDEHRILWQVMSTLFHYPEIPEDVLSGDLVGRMYPIKTSTVQPDGLFDNPTDFWKAFDNKIKASVNYIVTLPLDPDIAFTAPLVKTKTIDTRPLNEDTAMERIVQVAGLIYKAGKPEESIREAMVLVKETGMTAVINSKGYYTFPNIQPGKHTFQVVIEGKKIKDIEITVPSKDYDIEI